MNLIFNYIFESHKITIYNIYSDDKNSWLIKLLFSASELVVVRGQKLTDNNCLQRTFIQTQQIEAEIYTADIFRSQLNRLLRPLVRHIPP